MSDALHGPHMVVVMSDGSHAGDRGAPERRGLTPGGPPSTDSLRRMLEQGNAAPDFTLPDQDGNAVSLADLKGQTVVLYFYPKADTPGCTTQACGVRDHLPDYERAGVRVLGISPD